MKTGLELPQLPSHDSDAERAILGALLLDPERLSVAQDLVNEADFYHPTHRIIFHAMRRLADGNEPIDQVTLTHQLKRDGHLDECGGAAYLAELWGHIPSAANVSAHCRLIRDHAQRRRLAAVGHAIVAKTYTHETPIDVLIETAEQAVFAVAHQTSASAFHSIGDLVASGLDDLELLYQQKKHVTGVATGFPSFDRLTGGLQPEDLIILGARPSMGKTALALAIARHVAVVLQRPVGIFSLEMSKKALTKRILSAEANVDAHAIRTGQLSASQWSQIAIAAERLHGVPLFIDESSMLSVSQLRSKARRLRAQHGIDLLIIDYLQLLQYPKDSESRQQAMADISRDLKLLARELAVPVLALAQLNRKVEDRDDKRPLLSDLRDSGAFEQDADVVTFIYRDEVYDRKSSDKGIAEILVRKHRNGPIGDLRLMFLERFVKFTEMPNG